LNILSVVYNLKAMNHLILKLLVGMVTGLKSWDYEDRLKELGMSSLSQRREEMDLSEMYKIRFQLPDWT
jgi:hypothetical protein